MGGIDVPEQAALQDWLKRAEGHLREVERLAARTDPESVKALRRPVMTCLEWAGAATGDPKGIYRASLRHCDELLSAPPRDRLDAQTRGEVAVAATRTAVEALRGAAHHATVLRPRPGSQDARRLGSFLRSERQRAELTVDEVADKIRKSAPYVRMIERGEKTPAPETYRDLLRALGCDARLHYSDAIPTVIAKGKQGGQFTVELEAAATREALVAARVRQLEEEELRQAAVEEQRAKLYAIFNKEPREGGSSPSGDTANQFLRSGAISAGSEASLLREILALLGDADEATLRRAQEALSRDPTQGGRSGPRRSAIRRQRDRHEADMNEEIIFRLQDEPPPAHLSANRIKRGAKALSDFADGYLAIEEQNTSPGERARLHRADELIEDALNEFS